MSEPNNRENFPRYDDMTTEELQEILRKHAHNELEAEIDPQELYQIMAVLSERRQSADTPAFRSDEEAYRDFCEHYLPRAKEGGKPAAVKPFKRFCRSAAAIVPLVLVLAVTVAVALGGSASDYDLRDGVGVWDDRFFTFETNPSEEGMPVATFPPNREELVKFDSLQEALTAHGVTEDFVPAWLPEGYELTDVYAYFWPDITFIVADYIKDGNYLSLEVTQYFRPNKLIRSVSKDENPVEMYESNGKSYYIFTNLEFRVAACSVDNYEYFISGKISLEEMKQIIDSI